MRPTTDRPSDGLLHELSQEECWAHLVQHHVGRISYLDRDFPVILPLNYVVRARRLFVQTASYNQLAIHLPGQHVAFEIDHVDERTRSGWSVLVRGVAEHATDGDRGHVEGRDEPTPWPDGFRSMVFRLVPVEVTGRRLRQHDVAPAAGHGPGTTQRSSPASTS